MKTVNIGFIGTGGIAQQHIRALQQLPQARIAWVYDVNTEAALISASEIGAQVAETAEQLLDRDRVEAVYLCTPPFARGEWDVMAAQRGIHLFAEKPIGLDISEVRRKSAEIVKADVITAAGYCLRYYDTVQEARRYLQGKSVHLVQAHRFGTAHGSSWWWQLDRSGGHLVDAVTHQIDLIRYLLGEYREVYAQFGRTTLAQTAPETTIYDAGALNFTLSCGAVGSLAESCVSPYQRGSEIKVFGKDFFLCLTNNRTLTIEDAEGKRVMEASNQMMLEQSRAFLDAIISGDQTKVACSYADALPALTLTLAANQSAELGSPVLLQAGGGEEAK